MNQTGYPSIAFKILFWAIVTFCVFTIPQYGLTWDEPVQHHLGKANLDYLLNKTDKLALERDDLVFYGPGFEILNQITGSFLRKSFNMQYPDAYHILPLVFFLISLWFLYKLVHKLFGNETVAFASIVALLLFPRYLAHAYFNSKDAPIAALTIIIIYFWYSGTKGKNLKQIMVGSALFGYSLSIRMDAVIIAAIFAVSYILKLLIEWKDEKNNLKQIIRYFLYSLPVCLLAFFVLWPQTWKDPLIVFRSYEYFLHHGWLGEVLYLGKTYTSSAVPWHYAFFYVFLTIPLVSLIFGVIGLVRSVKMALKRVYTFEGIIIVLWLFLPLLITLKNGVLRYDGVRHYLLVLPAFAILTGLGFEYTLSLFASIKDSEKQNNLKKLFVCIVLGLMLWQTIIIFPFGDSYYNEIVQKIYSKNIENSLEIEYWGATYRQGVGWLNTSAAKNSMVCVPFAEHLISAYPIRQDLIFGCSKDSDYLMFFPRLTYTPKNLDDMYKYKNLEPAYKISRLNSSLLYIYKLK
jgi:hypothetical protein